MTLEVETIASGELIGQVIPPTPATVKLVLVSGDTHATTPADEHGVFTFAELPASPFCLECAAANGSWTVRTSWIIA